MCSATHQQCLRVMNLSIKLDVNIGSNLDQGCQTFMERVGSTYFWLCGHVIFIATTQLCHCRVKIANSDKVTNQCGSVSKSFIYKNSQWARFAYNP